MHLHFSFKLPKDNVRDLDKFSMSLNNTGLHPHAVFFKELELIIEKSKSSLVLGFFLRLYTENL